jgi:hypothetical protein
MHQPHLNFDHLYFAIDAHLETELNEMRKDDLTNHLIDALLEALDMKILGPLQIYDATDLTAPGWSFIQPITTSHISGHYFCIPNERPHIHIDIYTVKPFLCQAAVNIMHDHLSLSDWIGTFVLRDMSLHTRQHIEIVGEGNKIHKEIKLSLQSDFGAK